ncbi:MAG: DUF1080 domain-containing protein [Bacteroidales bacterium]|nr:DUF1080 domain-containing protein [Bacteroidales bacterium]MCF8390799.1 DUF1080 domain-containing protein [Bacteroidales bacterium]
MRKTLLSLLGAAILLASCTNTKTDTTPWVSLFNGVDLSGFVQRGGNAVFEARESVILGVTVWGTPNSFLCTEQEYSDFILEMEYMLVNPMNSGIQFRSLSNEAYMDGRVHGYQFEMDPSERAFSGGIYDEARTGWLYALNEEGNEEAQSAYRSGGWNKVRIEAIGNSIKTWLNGVPVSNLLDEQTAKGFIALQVHAIKDSADIGHKVMWRDIKILTTDLEKYSSETTAPERSYLVNKLTEDEVAEGWKLLFDGVSSKGWRKAYADAFPEKGWSIENGMISVMPSDGAESQNGGDIVTIDEYSNFDIKLQAKYTPGANSGVKYFVTEAEEGNNKSAIGLEFQILDDFLHPDALLGRTEGIRKLGSLYDLISPENVRRNNIGEWNNIRIISNNNHVEHWLNGFKVLEYERGSEEFKKLVSESKYKDWPAFGEAESGHILLQDHGNEVSFQSIKIKTLN